MKNLRQITIGFLSLVLVLGSSRVESQERIIFESQYLKCSDTVLIFKPRVAHSYPTPALYLLHGWSGNYSNWSKKTNMQAVADKYGFIIITPDGFYDSWYLNNVDTNKMQWRAFFDNELYPVLKDRLQLDPARTFITGLSMGGHGAINIFMDDTTRFAAAGSMSGVLDIPESRLKTGQIAQILGPYSADNKLYNTPSAIGRLDKLAGTKKIVLVSCGAQDELINSNIEFIKKATEKKIPNILLISPGVHSWKYWIYALDMHLNIFTRILDGENMGY